MSEKIQVVCGKCDKKLACPTSAAGRKLKCPSCGSAIRVGRAKPENKNSTELARSKRRPDKRGIGDKRRRMASNGQDSYQSTAPDSAANMLPTAKTGTKANQKKSSKSKRSDIHWSRKAIVGVGIMGASIVSSVVQLAIQGQPNMRTAEGKGQAFGQAFVTICGLIFGLVIVIRSFKARRDDR